MEAPARLSSAARPTRPLCPEVAIRPALRLRALDPSHRDAQRAQLAEQARAPALAVEDQRQAWCASACQQAQLAQLRHHPVPDLRHHAGVYLAVQAQQRRPAQRVHPVADRGRPGQLLAGHEMFRQPALTAVDLHVAIDEQRGDGLRIVCTPGLGQAADPGRQPLGSGQLARAAAKRGARPSSAPRLAATRPAVSCAARPRGAAASRRLRSSLPGAAGLRARSLSVTVTLGGRAGASPWQALAGR